MRSLLWQLNAASAVELFKGLRAEGVTGWARILISIQIFAARSWSVTVAEVNAERIEMFGAPR